MILKAGLVRVASLAFYLVSLTPLMYIIFATYAGTGGELTPKKVFTTLSLLLVLRLTVTFFSKNVLYMVESRVAVVRLQVTSHTNQRPSHITFLVSFQKLLELEELHHLEGQKFLGTFIFNAACS